MGPRLLPHPFLLWQNLKDQHSAHNDLSGGDLKGMPEQVATLSGKGCKGCAKGWALAHPERQGGSLVNLTRRGPLTLCITLEC